MCWFHHFVHFTISSDFQLKTKMKTITTMNYTKFSNSRLNIEHFRLLKIPLCGALENFQRAINIPILKLSYQFGFFSYFLLFLLPVRFNLAETSSSSSSYLTWSLSAMSADGSTELTPLWSIAPLLTNGLINFP